MHNFEFALIDSQLNSLCSFVFLSFNFISAIFSNLIRVCCSESCRGTPPHSPEPATCTWFSFAMAIGGNSVAADKQMCLFEWKIFFDCEAEMERKEKLRNDNDDDADEFNQHDIAFSISRPSSFPYGRLLSCCKLIPFLRSSFKLTKKKRRKVVLFNCCQMKFPFLPIRRSAAATRRLRRDMQKKRTRAVSSRNFKFTRVELERPK